MSVPPGVREQRRARAAEHLARARPGRWYLPLLGVALAEDRIELDDATAIERVVAPPTEAELAAALTEPRLFAYLGRFAPLVASELVVERRPGAGAQTAAALATVMTTAFAMRCDAAAHVLAECDHSWSALPALVDGRCAARLVDALSPTRVLGAPVTVAREDLDWAWARRKPLADLLETPRFCLAADALTTHRAETNRRLAVAKLWSGVEALLPPDDNRLRLAAAAALVLEPATARRRELYDRVTRLLAGRRAVLAGQPLDAAALETYAADVRALLARLLVFFTDRGELPEGIRLDDLVVWSGRPTGAGAGR